MNTHIIESVPPEVNEALLRVIYGMTTAEDGLVLTKHIRGLTRALEVASFEVVCARAEGTDTPEDMVKAAAAQAFKEFMEKAGNQDVP